MATEAQILSSLSPNVVVGDPVGPCLSQRVLSPSSTSVEDPLQISYFLCKTNPIFKKVK